MRSCVLTMLLTAICAFWSQTQQEQLPPVSGITVISSFDTGTLAADFADAVDARLSGKDPMTDGALWQTFDPDSQTYERSTGFWASNLDLSCKSVWNSASGTQRGATMITPRHALIVSHAPYDNGTILHFVGADNSVHIATITASAIVTHSGTNPDMTVCVLDQDVPDFITPRSVLPLSAQSQLPQSTFFVTEYRVPCLRINQFEQGVVDAVLLIAPPVAVVSRWNAVGDDAARKAFWSPIISGDSGCPAFFILDNQPVLIGICRTAIQLNFPGGYPDEINAAIATADALAGISTGYQITLANLT